MDVIVLNAVLSDEAKFTIESTQKELFPMATHNKLLINIIEKVY